MKSSFPVSYIMRCSNIWLQKSWEQIFGIAVGFSLVFSVDVYCKERGVLFTPENICLVTLMRLLSKECTHVKDRGQLYKKSFTLIKIHLYDFRTGQTPNKWHSKPASRRKYILYVVYRYILYYCLDLKCYDRIVQIVSALLGLFTPLNVSNKNVGRRRYQVVNERGFLWTCKQSWRISRHSIVSSF